MIHTMGDREIYPNPSVALVALELRHTRVDLSAQVLDRLKETVSGSFPIHKVERLAFQVNPESFASGPVEHLHRYLSRDRFSSITFGPEGLVVETTRYERWEEFLGWVELALIAYELLGAIDGVERLGLRYID